MKIRTAYSTNPSVEAAVCDVQRQLLDTPGGAVTAPRAVLFFASSTYAPERVGSVMQDAFPGSVVFGCTTAGEIVGGMQDTAAEPGGMLKDAVVAMAFDEDAIGDVALQVVDLRDGDGVKQAFRAFERHYGCSMQDLDPSRYVGLVLVDGLSGAEEAINDRIGDLTNVAFVGGSAGDDLAFEKTYLFADGSAVTNAALLVLMKPKVAFDVVKTQSFRVLDRELVPTQVNEATREVIAFGHRPAAEAYAEAVACPVDEAAGHFMRHPVGLMVGDEPFVRSPQRFNGDRIVFYCDVKAGMPLRLLETGDIVRDTRAALAAKAAEMGGLSAVVNFHCILRTLELEARGETGAYGDVFADVPTVGFSTYGESYIGHMNQTSTMLVFGRAPRD